MRSVPGFEQFDLRRDVLHCDKPGTGSVDAPRCFSMKLNLCTQQDCHMKSSSVDGEMCMLHVDVSQAPPSPTGTVHFVPIKTPKLVALLTKHVDDLKITGETEWVMWILNKLQAKFGKLKIIWDKFTNCGVRHDLLADGSRTLDQFEYASNLRIIDHSDLKHVSSDTDCSQEVHELYRSLLGAVAFLYLTRADVLVFITACQRHGHAPKVIHVKRLNTILKWIQAHPKRLKYSPFKHQDSHLCVVSDAAFKKEDEKDKAHSLRGTLYLRTDGRSTHGDCNVHCIEYMSKALRNVTRSTFAAELLAACDSIDLGILIQLMIHEIEVGPVTASEARDLRMRGGYAVPMTLQVDAKSVYAAVTATYIKAPAEKNLLSHIQFVRELLDSGVLKTIQWIDTRDMAADGLTKGTIDRNALHDIMNGFRKYQHAYEEWESKIAPTRTTE